MKTKQLSFDSTKEEMALIQGVVKRALREMPDYPDDAISLSMDLTACNANGCPLDFKKLLAAPRFDFWHDIGGIRRHINRNTGQLMDCFLPRCSR